MRLKRSYYDSTFSNFRIETEMSILGNLADAHGHDLNSLQKNAWLEQIRHLKSVLQNMEEGHVFFEFAIPRMGKRADVILLIGSQLFVLEYKVNATEHTAAAFDQALDYALDLKNFHSGSHHLWIAPIVVATDAPAQETVVFTYDDNVLAPLGTNSEELLQLLEHLLTLSMDEKIDPQEWSESIYRPTPTIIEASQALYEGHNVEDISRHDAGDQNLTATAECIQRVIRESQATGTKSICFVTGVPGAGKTLAGLNIANQHREAYGDKHSVFLSGNGPLVAVLREALARDDVAQAQMRGEKLTKKMAAQKAEAFIQNIHHFRDDNLTTPAAPVESVVVFDEAQRAWNSKQLATFMKVKRGLADFGKSEPEFLLEVMNRRDDWCTVVCLIGGGQEINTGEVGLVEWARQLDEKFGHWRVYYSDRFSTDQYDWGQELIPLFQRMHASQHADLHLGVSIRSFRSERVSAFVNALMALPAERAASLLPSTKDYPIFLTREIGRARTWLKERARGSERCGLVASSNALRLKSEGLFVKEQIDPANWFLNGKEDVRSSYYLEDVATEFDIQGLELDWVGICWDANLRHDGKEWVPLSFRGSRWMNVNNQENRKYLLNAYRILLTRARQGMVIFVPRGSAEDPTRQEEFYDGVLEYLSKCGIPLLPGE